MIKKIVIEQEDKEEMLKWQAERFEMVTNELTDLSEEKEEIYLISFDIAKHDSNDKSVMMQFRLVDGQYIYEGHKEI